jgi:hypothetical protein
MRMGNGMGDSNRHQGAGHSSKETTEIFLARTTLDWGHYTVRGVRCVASWETGCGTYRVEHTALPNTRLKIVTTLIRQNNLSLEPLTLRVLLI